MSVPTHDEPHLPRRPFVLVNMAMTADGKIATANRRIDSFSSEQDQAHLLELRATADAVLCAAGTVKGAGVTLGTGGPRYQRLRRKRGLADFNLRIVASGQARIPPTADVFRDSDGAVIILVTRSAPSRRVEALRKVAAEVVAFGEAELDLAEALEWLRKKRGVQRLVCEGGGQLNDAMFRAGLVDEVHVTLCPKIFGGREAPTLADGEGVDQLARGFPLVLQRVRRLGDELYLVYCVREHRSHQHRLRVNARSDPQHPPGLALSPPRRSGARGRTAGRRGG